MNLNILKEFLAKNKKYLCSLLIILGLAIALEILVFNFSSLKTMGEEPVTIATDVVTDDGGFFETGDITVNTEVKNVYIDGVILFNAQSLSAKVALTDEGNEYEYSMPEFRVIPEVYSTGYVNIYPYGKVNTINISIAVPEGSAAAVGNIIINAKRPVDIKLLRLLVMFIFLWLIFVFWNQENNEFVLTPYRKDSKVQMLFTILVIVALILFGKRLAVSNERIVSSPWPHHKQYQELAESLSVGTVKLLNKEPAPELLLKENPYDTIALSAENIPYNMDYAYYEGSYYVYFGIVPELLLYYPYYKVKGYHLNNYSAQYLLFSVLVIGVFITIRQLIFRYSEKTGKSSFPYILYLLISIGFTLLSNNIYLVSRGDIYNVPIMAATAFIWMGFGMWLIGVEKNSTTVKRIAATAMGSLCMALSVGCRPQFALYSLSGVFLYLFVESQGNKGNKESKKSKESKENILSLSDRRLFKRAYLFDTLAFVIPYALVAMVVCWYNYARFGSIFEFGATLSLTTNDMNHRGFNFDRLFKGLYAFLFQPVNLTLDFPYLKSSSIMSDYMGRNMTEFIYGGCFAANPIFLLVFVPLFGLWKRVGKEAKALFLTFLSVGMVIAAFDVNGAGILYRYTCDFMPAIALSTLIILINIWGILEDKEKALFSKILFVLLSLLAINSFLVFLGTGDSVNLRDNSIMLYERIREYFRV